MEMESVGVPAIEQPYYNVKRPVDDLWLWWTLANVIGYLVFDSIQTVGQVLLRNRHLAHCNFCIDGSAIWVFNRYLSNFNWKQWVVVTIVGSILGFVIVFQCCLLWICFTSYSPRQILGTESVMIYQCIALVGVVLALAQWRVLKHYARGQGQNLWVVANVISVIIFALLYGAVKQLSDNAYLQIAGNTIASALKPS